MSRLFAPIAVLAIQVLGLLLLGCWLLLTPTRAGNLLHDAFLVFPPVSLGTVKTQALEIRISTRRRCSVS
jgi:hypothetical protein